MKKYPKEDWKVGGLIKYRCLSEGISKGVEAIFLDEEDLKIPSPILYEISRDGQTIYGRDILTELRTLCAQVKPIFTEEGKKVGWQIY